MRRNSRNSDARVDFQRAMILLSKRIHTVQDLLEYWHFSGQCKENHPDIEKI